MDPITTATGVFAMLNDLTNGIAKAAQDSVRTNALISGGSLTDIAKIAQVEPTVIVSPDCLNLDYMPQVQQTLLSLFCAYYLQAVDILAAVKDVQTLRILDKLNPNRDATGLLLMNENHLQYSLPLPGQKLTMEASKESNNIQDAVNLCVGRMLEVSFANESNSPAKDKNGQYLTDRDGNVVLEKKTNNRTMKVSVRLMVSSIPESSITSILTNGTEDRGIRERFHAWRSGKLKFIRDIVLAQDLIDAKYKMAVTDKSGKGAEMLQRVAQNKRFGVLTNNPSLGTASNIFVISEEIASQLEYKLGGKLTDYRARQKLFETSYAMILVVINRETSRMKFFVRGQTDYTNVSKKEIENMSKGGKGPDVMELFRSLQTASFSNF